MTMLRARWGVIVLLLALPLPAAAQQPLSTFLDAAERGNLNLRAARAALSQAQGQVDLARARLLPYGSAQGTYTHNEYPIEFAQRMPDGTPGPTITIQPQDQLTGVFVVGTPLLDLSAWANFLSAEASATAADHRVDNVDREAQGAVVMLWYQLVASRQLVEAAQHTLETAQQNFETAQARVEVGAAPQLEQARAEAEVQRAQQQVAEARLGAVLAARNLENATYLTPSDRPVELEDDLHPEPPLEHFMPGARQHPAVEAARSDVLAAERALHAAWFSLAPTIGANLTERVTNATSFSGRSSLWMLNVTATWNLDFSRPAAIGTQDAVTQQARIRLEQAAQQVETSIFESWQRVEAQRARAAAARAQVVAAQRAFDDARARFDAGAATQLDVIQAQRDLFSAQVAYISAVADLRVSRDLLRIRSGIDMGGVQ